jgi:hypothetical protein
MTTQHLLDVALKEVKRLKEELEKQRDEILADLKECKGWDLYADRDIDKKIEKYEAMKNEE